MSGMLGAFTQAFQSFTAVTTTTGSSGGSSSSSRGSGGGNPTAPERDGNPRVLAVISPLNIRRRF
jgi:hypothetical protein